MSGTWIRRAPSISFPDPLIGGYPYRYIPDLIKGDLDSLREDVREYYSTKVRLRRLRSWTGDLTTS